MPDEHPLLLLIAADERAAILDTLRRYHAMTAAQLTAALNAAAPTRGAERLAIVAPASTMYAAIAFAIARLPAIDQARWAVRAQGIIFTRDQSPGRVAFLFPGQGSQHFGMLRQLRRRLPAVRGWFDALDRAAVASGQPPLTALLDTDASDPAIADRRVALHDMERGAQLGTVADLALYDVLRSLGVAADLHIGHSNGEHPAVIAAGRVTMSRAELCESFVRLGATGARLPKPPVPEGLLAVSAVSRETLDELLRVRSSTLSLAMDNCPHQLVVGGTAAALAALAGDITTAGGVAATLPFARAFHTPLFADWSDTLARYYRALPMGPGRVPVYSCRTTEPLPDAGDACREVMTAQWTGGIRFRDTIERVYADGARTFVEVGPGSALTAFVEDVLRGRPHLAVSSSSAARDDIAQLCHMLGELFVAGLAIDPARLPALLDTVEAWHDAAAVHRGLIADARQRLARIESLRAAPRVSPLLGASTRDGSGRLTARRRFTRASDPFVDDHALGRRSAAHPAGGYPLPVLPFTLSLAIVAEAAHALTGRRVTEIRDARASRWLALDMGALILDISAAPSGSGVAVRLAESGGRAPGPAFEATADTGRITDAPPSIPPDPGARAPRQWTARSFYERYAFHGSGFQGLSEVRTVGPAGIEADVVITDIRGLPPETLDLDPAMLDCAGQLVAFWLLEHEGRPPTFGIFPFSAARVRIVHPLPPRGARLRCRCAIARQGAVTDAVCVFETPDGRLVASIEGFLQRLVPFPETLARTIFGGERATRSSIRAIDPEVFTESWGIWARALAHIALTPGDLAHWHAMPARSDRRLQWLVERIAEDVT